MSLSVHVLTVGHQIGLVLFILLTPNTILRRSFNSLFTFVPHAASDYCFDV
jgi:hypothetical protein